ARLTTDDSALVFVVADESMTDGRAHDGTHDRAASRERVRARARSNCSWKGYRHGAAFDLEPKLANGCAHRSRASAHLSEQMHSSGAIARVQINGARRIAQSLHMPGGGLARPPAKHLGDLFDAGVGHGGEDRRSPNRMRHGFGVAAVERREVGAF